MATRRATEKDSSAAPCLTEAVHAAGRDAVAPTGRGQKKGLAQYLTPAPVARLMAGMFEERRSREVCVFDPGAGAGILTAAAVEAVSQWTSPPSRIRASAFELDEDMAPRIRDTFHLCAEHCRRRAIAFTGELHQGDFLERASAVVGRPLFQQRLSPADMVIMNPPFRKIRTDSRERRLLESVGIETSNLYSGFVALAIRALRPGGQLVFISPRSFCNGTYFRQFREMLLCQTALRRVHLFESRTEAFRDYSVIQETVVFHAVKGDSPAPVRITSSRGGEEDEITSRQVAFAEVVRPDDPRKFIHLPTDEAGLEAGHKIRLLTHSLRDLGLRVSTGRVVAFRAADHLLDSRQPGSVPLIQPGNICSGRVVWPDYRLGKPAALEANDATRDLLVPEGTYVLVRRFSAKEERRRIVAGVYESCACPGSAVAFENHLNYYHARGGGLNPDLARGLSAFLNSTVVDRYFRTFNGHTQVNAADLRSLRYPSLETLVALGQRVGPKEIDQGALDAAVGEECFL